MEPSALNSTTLRLALGLRGGVSLAVWIGGAVAELDAFRHARGSTADDYYSRLLAVGRYDSVEIDVMSGASAGGLNAVLAVGGDDRRRDDGGSAAHVVVRGRVCATSSTPTPVRRRIARCSNGTYFLEQIERQRASSCCPAAGRGSRRSGIASRCSSAPRCWTGLPVPIVDDEFSSEEASRAGAFFHFRHVGATAGGERLRGRPGRAAVAGGAHHRIVPDGVRTDRVRPSRSTTTRARSTCARSCAGGCTSAGRRRERSVRLLDGGVVDNIPVARALRGLPNVPADNATDRWLIYMQPSPDPLPIVRTVPRRRDPTTI